MLEVNNLSKQVQNRIILNNVNFQIEQGQIGVFLGGSGVGKSTLLRVLTNLESYDTGSFILDGHPLDLNRVAKNHTIGMVFQHFNLFENLTVAENITLALVKLKSVCVKDANQIAYQLLERYGLEDKFHSSVQKLSGGQKQRLAIARTLALDPKIVCLDEPTSALDPLLTNQVAKYISNLAKDNRIVLLATHDTNLISQLDAKVFLMKNGEIAESCLSKEFQENSSSYPLLSNFLKGV